MFTSIDKALVALLGSLVYFAAQFVPAVGAFANPDMIQNIGAMLSPFLVWWIANQA